MNARDIEHMWKVASNNPSHDTNWHDPVVIAFADLIRADEREALIRYFDGHWRSDWSDGQIIEALEARGNT